MDSFSLNFAPQESPLKRGRSQRIQLAKGHNVADGLFIGHRFESPTNTPGVSGTAGLTIRGWRWW
jgi:hypothetical protein